MFDVRQYAPAGATLKRFHESPHFTRLIAGPIGSAKTTSAFVAEPFFATMLQRPNADGVREAVIGGLRDTYRNLYTTTLRTWHEWVPRDYGRFVGSDDRPATHEFEFHAPFTDGTPGQGLCRCRYEWRALGTHAVEAVCRGWELHGAGIDEADLVPIEALSFLAGRVQRGGRKEYRVTRGVWGTFNKPDTDHPLFTKCVEEAGQHAEQDFEFFDQPPGLLPGGPPFRTNPAAENLPNLDDGYYVRSAQGQPEWYIRRMLRNLWGASVAGEPVFSEADIDALFSPVELEPEPMSELSLGLDGGGTPAAVIGGRTVTGRRVIYGEVVLADPSDPRGRRLLHGVGPKRFAEAIGDTLLPRFGRCNITIGWGDPAAFYGADREMGEYSFMEIVGNHLKLPIQPAPSNEIDIRLEAVRGPMNRLNRYDGQRDLLINPSCRWIRRGFSGDYKWEPRDPKQPAKRLKPQKSVSSHVMDALQYWCLGDTGRAGVIAGQKFDRVQPAAPEGFSWNGAGVLTPGKKRGDSYGSDWNPWGS